MTRELKFRAWDKITKQICNVWSVNFKAWDDGCPINYITIETDETVERLEHEVELMQFTGIKDKNGKEIYEGDIVLVTTKLNEKDPVLKHEFQIKYEIYFSNGCFYAKTNNYHLGRSMPMSNLKYDIEYDKNKMIRSLELIGNIYENPELMEE